jgi:hypothetical protein
MRSDTRHSAPAIKKARIEVLDAAGAIVETIEHDPGCRDNANTFGGV